MGRSPQICEKTVVQSGNVPPQILVFGKKLVESSMEYGARVV